jgi:hypothetical protein
VTDSVARPDNEKKQARVRDRMMELLVVFQRRVFETATPNKIVELFDPDGQDT